MDISAKITSVEAELVQLKNELVGVSEAEKLELRKQITVKEAQLTELYRHIPVEPPAGK